MSYFFKIAQKRVKIFNYHKTEAGPVFIQRFFKIKKTFVSRRRPSFTRVRAEVTISFEKLTDEPS